MFSHLGKTVSRFWPLCLVAWVLILAGFQWAAPPLESVIKDGEFRYLPAHFDSRKGERLFEEAFSNDFLGSNIVIVARRESNREGLLERDRRFIRDVLKPRLERTHLLTDIAAVFAEDPLERTETLAEIEEWLAGVPGPAALEAVRDWHVDLFAGQADPDPDTNALAPLDRRIVRQLEKAAVPLTELSPRLRDRLAHAGEVRPGAAQWTRTGPVEPAERPEPIVGRIRTPEDAAIGELLVSEDNKAALIAVELTTEFQEYRNRPIIRNIEWLIGDEGPLRREKDEAQRIPPGLDLTISGSATVGRDMRRAAENSAKKIDWVTIVLVLLLLLAIYRAPVLVFIPLLVVAASVHTAVACMTLLAQAGIIDVFGSLKIYLTVVLYGAGVDYCMFLIARYKEELDAGAPLDEAVATAVGKVGSALAASAGTTMAGIGMMAFAQFGKFQQAGIAMSLSLVFVLAAALTFAPAMLRLFGRWAFWPYMKSERIPAAAGWLAPTSLMARLIESNWFRGTWERIGQALLRKPATIWLTAMAVMAPFALIGVLFFGHLSYGLLSELPDEEPSVVGTKAVQAHFPAGMSGPVTVLLKNDEVDFGRSDGKVLVAALSKRLEERKDELGIADIRSIANPLGITPAADRAEGAWQGQVEDLSDFQKVVKNRRRDQKIREHYIANKGELARHVTRLDVVFQFDPFSRETIDRYETFRQALPTLLPDNLRGSQLFYVGATPSIRDLKAVTNSDQVRIDLLVIASVFLVLVILLRRPAISAYLIVSVFFSYLVTLGAAYTLFWALDPAGFAGLDWKVPMFLFTILIAVGEDYNIYLITRIDEEQQRHGPVQGVIVALAKTGGIISSCGIIMAGTFSALLWGSLAGIQQLGFALAFGVLLDTFVVRPILVPAYLILLHSGRFGSLGKLLGAETFLPAQMPTPLGVGHDSQVDT